MDVDWPGIRRTARALGGDGTVYVLLRGEGPFEPTVLDAALPRDRAGRSPVNGGWSAGPGGWFLLLEGPPDVVEAWLVRVAHGLEGAGVTGTLTGAPAVAPPVWARRLTQVRTLYAHVGLRVAGG